jgi:hypothetical protein
MSAGTATRERYYRAMAATAVGTKLARHSRAWTVVQRRAYDTSVTLTLRHGRRTLSVIVPVCITGPCWADVGLRPVAAAPVQRELLT